MFLKFPYLCLKGPAHPCPRSKPFCTGGWLLMPVNKHSFTYDLNLGSSSVFSQTLTHAWIQYSQAFFFFHFLRANTQDWPWSDKAHLRAWPVLDQQRKAVRTEGWRLWRCRQDFLDSQVAGNIRRLCASVGKNRMVLDKSPQKWERRHAW